MTSTTETQIGDLKQKKVLQQLVWESSPRRMYLRLLGWLLRGIHLRLLGKVRRRWGNRSARLRGIWWRCSVRGCNGWRCRRRGNTINSLRRRLRRGGTEGCRWRMSIRIDVRRSSWLPGQHLCRGVTKQVRKLVNSQSDEHRHSQPSMGHFRSETFHLMSTGTTTPT